MKKTLLLLLFLYPVLAVTGFEYQILISTLQDSTKTLHYSRVAEKFTDGKIRDRISIDYDGKEMGAIVKPGEKVAFVINEKLYEEEELKKLLKERKNLIIATSSKGNRMNFNTAKYAKVFVFN